MRRKDRKLLRYALWLGVAGTAYANRKHFGLPTTWVFHLTLNSLFLFLPEIVRGSNRALNLEARAKRREDFVSTAYGTIQDAVVENPNYGFYVAPVALAYMVSHPRFNIYKGAWSELRLLGFGLDALPHSLTAFAFTRLMMDTLAAFRRHTPRDASWRALADHADENSDTIAGALLIGASTLYESGEYAIHQEEMRETGGDESRINLMWSAQDTLFDLLSNALGWVAAVALRHPKRKIVVTTDANAFGRERV
jgi:hypothetical protein